MLLSLLACSGGSSAVPSLPERGVAESCGAPASFAPCSADPDAAFPNDCAADADCGAGALGRCIPTGSYALGCGCVYAECGADSDCAVHEACACATGADNGLYDNACIPADCRSDADCPAPGLCLATRENVCGGPPGSPAATVSGWHCATDADTCRGDEACTGNQRCLWDGARFACDALGSAMCD